MGPSVEGTAHQLEAWETLEPRSTGRNPHLSLIASKLDNTGLTCKSWHLLLGTTHTASLKLRESEGDRAGAGGTAGQGWLLDNRMSH